MWIGLRRGYTIFLIELVQVWQIAPLAALLILAALQAIPARALRGRPRRRGRPLGVFRRITLPLIRPGLAVAMVESLILSLNIFDQAYVLNGFAPGGASIMLQTYRSASTISTSGRATRSRCSRPWRRCCISLGILAVVYRRVEF